MVDKFIGEVCFFNPDKGFGFISWQKDNIQQVDIFVHYSDISMSGYKTLYRKQKVTFELGINHHGDPKAINVTLI